MKVEILIYAYLAVCAAMIGFNIVCIFVFRRKDKKIDKHSDIFTDKIEEQLERSEIDPAHKKYLSRKLRRIGNLMAFDKTLEQFYAENPEKIQRYIEAISSVFIYLTLEYRKKSKLQTAYFPYIIKKYKVFCGKSISIVSDIMLELVGNESLYCRENALQALYTIGDVGRIIEALRIVDESTYYHNPKLITDGLLTFTGDKEKLWDALWKRLPKFSISMQVTVLDYFRFCSGEHCKRMLQILTSDNSDDEIKYSCIRYFGKYGYEPAYAHLLKFAEEEDGQKWEYAAISATALANYPGERTTETLKSLLHSRNWYVRFNASQSLERLGLDYSDLIDVFDDDDRFAGEMMRYRLDQKKMREKEAVPV